MRVVKNESAIKFVKSFFKIIKIIFAIFAVVILLFAVLSVYINNESGKKFLGLRPYIVVSPSMEPAIKKGDLIFVRSVDIFDLKEGDIISYKSSDPVTYGLNITHRIIKITEQNGQRFIKTKGDANNKDDDYTVSSSYIYGKYVGKIGGLGYFIDFLKTPAGYILFVVVPFGLIIIGEGVWFLILMKKNKKEVAMVAQLERDEIEKQRQEAIAEKTENAKILEELKILRQKMSEKLENLNKNDSDNDS